MLSDILASFIILGFVFFGLKRPHYALACVAWIDIYKPQSTSFSFLHGAPLSLLLTAFFFLTIVLNPQKVRVPRSVMYHFLMLGLMTWITISTFGAQFQSLAWLKYDIAIKTLILAYFIPFVLVNRYAIESFLYICAISFGTFIFFAGVKTLFGGGGYGVDLIGIGGFMWSEGSSLSTQAISMVPLFWWLGNHSKLSERKKFIRWIMYGYILCSFLTVIGTQARTGIVCIAVLAMLLMFQSKQKVKLTAISVMLAFVLLPIISDSFLKRVESIKSTDNVVEESSAMGRVVVWRWTLDYVADKPLFGGGFYAYRANAGQLERYSKEGETKITTRFPKAFHNIFFEVLGEHGYGGLGLFLSLILLIHLLNKKLIKIYKIGNEVECSFTKARIALFKAMNISLLVYCAGGMFVGISFYPWLYYLLGITVGSYSVATQEFINNNRH